MRAIPEVVASCLEVGDVVAVLAPVEEHVAVKEGISDKVASKLNRMVPQCEKRRSISPIGSRDYQLGYPNNLNLSFVIL